LLTKRYYIQGDWGHGHQQAKKGVYPLPFRAIFEDRDISVHTCASKNTKNTQTEQTNTNQKTELIKKKKNTKQNKETKPTQQKNKN